MPGSTEAAEHSRKIAGVISEVMIESSTEHDLLYGPSIADAPKASLKDHTGRGAAGLCEDRPRPNRQKKRCARNCSQRLERVTRLDLATSTLARWRSTG